MNPSPQLARYKLRPSSDSPSLLPLHAGHQTTSHATGHTTSHPGGHSTGHASGHASSHSGGHASSHAGDQATSHAGGHVSGHTAGHSASHASGHSTSHICKDEMPNSTNGIRFRRRSTKTSTNHTNQECIIQMEGSPLKYQGQ